jgi:hypothetical protein
MSFLVITVSLAVAVFGPAETDRRFKGDGGYKNLWNIVSFYQAARRNIPEDR